MISKEKLIRKILKGKLDVLQAYSLVISNYNNKFLNDFLYELHEEIFHFYSEEIHSLSEIDIREIYCEVEKLNKINSENIEIEKISCSEEDYRIIQHFCLEVDDLAFVRNCYGLLNTDDSVFREVVDLNKLVFNYLSHESADFFYFILERLDCLRKFPLLIELLYRLDVQSIKFNDDKRVYLDYINKFSNLSPINLSIENDLTKKYYAKHYVLAYLIECRAKGESLPNGGKTELEEIGRQRTGKKKSGNTFYKEFNRITNSYDLTKINDLIAIGGENWRTIVKDLSNDPETIEIYLNSKQL